MKNFQSLRMTLNISKNLREKLEEQRRMVKKKNFFQRGTVNNDKYFQMLL